MHGGSLSHCNGLCGDQTKELLVTRASFTTIWRVKLSVMIKAYEGHCFLVLLWIFVGSVVCKMQKKCYYCICTV